MRSLRNVLGIAVVVSIFAFSASLASAQGDLKADTTKPKEQIAEKVNINKATVEQLMELKGIGESYAKRIVEYREKNGPFKRIEDIMEVRGIGTKLFESIKDQISV